MVFLLLIGWHNNTYLKQIKRYELTFWIKERIERDPFQTLTKESIENSSSIFIRIYERRIFRNIDVQQWEPRTGRPPFFVWPRATNSPILPSIYEKSESPLWRQINKASSSSEQSLVNSAISADLCGKKIVLRPPPLPAKGSLIVIPNGSRHDDHRRLYDACRSPCVLRVRRRIGESLLY